MAESRLESVPVKLIDPGNRARKDYKDIASLASDIKRRGLIHPIAVMEKDEGFLLLAGGRRLVATRQAGIPEIECKIFPPGLDELEIKSIELMENVMREDLDYADRVFLEREIFLLQQKIHGIKLSTSPDAPGVSQTDVANMMGISREKLRQDLELAETMDRFPGVEWKTLKNRQEALKLQTNIERVIVRQEAVKRFEQEVGTTQQEKYIKRIANSYIVGDFFELVKQIPSNSIDLVEIDPPYAINLEKLKKKDGIGEYNFNEDGYNEIDGEEYASFMQNTFRECYRVMAPNSWLLCWFGPEPWFNSVLTWLRNYDFIVRGIPCVWVKPTGQTNSPMRHLASAYEMFFYAKKGDPIINRQGMTNTFQYPPAPPTSKIHPTERPVELMADILTTFTGEGSRILVPYAGSGNTILAAYQNKMTAIGFDLGSLHKEAYIARLTNAIAI